MNIHRSIVLIFLNIVNSFFSFSQSGYDSFLCGNVPGGYIINEKILLQTDRNMYMVGEDINFSCFTYEPVLQRSLELSAIVYVEFFNSQNLVIDQLKIKIDKKLGNGVIRIPRGLITGRYYIRAYTNYMKNFGCEGFAYTSVTVINPFQPPVTKEIDDTSRRILEKCKLFVEGGQFVYGYPNKIICLFTSASEHPVTCEAKLLDKENRVISSFSSDSYGLGSVTFIPEPGNDYRIVAISGDEFISKSIEIPDKAIALAKEEQNENELKVRIQRFNFTASPLRLEINQSHSSVFYQLITELDSVIKIPTGNLPKGIIQISLRDLKNNLISGLSIYIPPMNNASLEQFINKTEYGNREKVLLTYDCMDTNKMIENVSLSVFMVDSAAIMGFEHTDKGEYLQSSLYSFLNRYVYPVNEVVRDSSFLESLLIMNLKEKFISFDSSGFAYDHLVYLPETDKDLIFGVLYGKDSIPLPSTSVMLAWIDSISYLNTSKTNEEGKFIFETAIQGKQNLILETRGADYCRYAIQDEFYPDFFSITREVVELKPEKYSFLKQQMLNLQIGDSYYKEKKAHNSGSPLPFYFVADKVFYIAQFELLPKLSDFIFEIMIPRVLISHQKDRTVIRISLPQSGLPFENQPLLLVDGIPVSDADLVGNLDCSDLLSVGVVYEKFFFKNEYFDGILDIHTKTGDASVLDIPDNIYSSDFTGIQDKPDLNFILVPGSHEPFFKTQLYWDPSVNLNKKGLTTIEMITPDNSGDYLIRSAVTAKDGSIHYYNSKFHVK